MTPALSVYVFAAARAEPIALGDDYVAVRPSPGQRPAGELVWIHLEGGEPPGAATTLADRIADERPQSAFLLSAHDPPHDATNRTWVIRPADFPRVTASFLEAWRPDVMVWIGGPIRPVIVAKARQAGIPVLLANATADHARGRRGIPARDLLRLFELVVAVADAAGPLIELAGDRVAPLGLLQRSAGAMDYNEAQHARLIGALRSRPTWYAAHATAAEIDTLTRAHSRCQGVSHRLLLIVRPHDPTEVAGMLQGAAFRTQAGTPPETAAIFVADTSDEDGIWYRLASTTFVGGTLKGPRAMVDPFHPAAHGSAVVHGPGHAPFGENFASLGQANAALQVTDAGSLAAAVGDLLAPDRAADLAFRAWSVVSEGAEATDRVASAVCRILDERA